MERFREGLRGFHPLIGGIQSGSGFAAGTYVQKEGLRVSAQGSIRGYQKYDLAFTAPQIAGEHFYVELRATYRNYPQEDFYGIGRNSRKEDRQNYRLEDSSYAGRIGVKPAKHLKAGLHAGWTHSYVGAGTDRRFPSIATEAFSDEYVKKGAFVEFDNRNEPHNPRSGGRYQAEWTAYSDRAREWYDFDRYDIEISQYFPFFNQRRVFAVRGKTAFTSTAPGHDIPFFLQPALGGAQDLRGFREYRFRDKYAVVLNAEYRWEAFSGLDLALFADAGQVAARPADLDFNRFKTSYGFGFRFNTAKSVFLRVDIGLSEEGRRLIFSSDHVF